MQSDDDLSEPEQMLYELKTPEFFARESSPPGAKSMLKNEEKMSE